MTGMSNKLSRGAMVGTFGRKVGWLAGWEEVSGEEVRGAQRALIQHATDR